MTKKSITQPEESHQELLNLLKGMQPVPMTCPKRSELKIIWFPTYSEKSVLIPDPSGVGKFTGQQRSDEGYQANVFHRCSYSGALTCRDCIGMGAFIEPEIKERKKDPK